MCRSRRAAGWWGVGCPSPGGELVARLPDCHCVRLPDCLLLGPSWAIPTLGQQRYWAPWPSVDPLGCRRVGHRPTPTPSGPRPQLVSSHDWRACACRSVRWAGPGSPWVQRNAYLFWVPARLSSLGLPIVLFVAPLFVHPATWESVAPPAALALSKEKRLSHGLTAVCWASGTVDASLSQRRRGGLCDATNVRR